MDESKAQLKDKSQQMLIDNIIMDAVMFEYPIIESFTAEKCWNRDFFERLVEAEVTKLCSGEDKITFIKSSKNQKG
jgi:hypothetical protein